MAKLATSGSLTDHEQILVQRLLPLIVATIDDRSWRVRWTAAAKFADVIKAYNPIPGAMDVLIPAYEKLLQDPEAEVRTAATFNLSIVAKECKTKILPLGAEDGMGEVAGKVTAAERLVKRVTSLTEDDSEHVRAALAMVATELAPILGKDETITHLVPPILLLLRDAASEVRLNLISSLESLNKVIGVDLLSQSLLPAIIDLAQDGKWRCVCENDLEKIANCIHFLIQFVSFSYFSVVSPLQFQNPIGHHRANSPAGEAIGKRLFHGQALFDLRQLAGRRHCHDPRSRHQKHERADRPVWNRLGLRVFASLDRRHSSECQLSKKVDGCPGLWQNGHRNGPLHCPD